MRNLKISMLFSAFALLLAFGCQKATQGFEVSPPENSPDLESVSFSELPNEIDTFDYTRCPNILQSVVNESGVLRFNSRLHFDECATCLEKEYEEYNESYEMQYPELTAAELDSIDEVNNFEEWTPVIGFEQNLNFASLRAKIEAEILSWLNNSGNQINWDEDPDNHPVASEFIRALLNEEGIAIAGNDTISSDEWDLEILAASRWDDCAFLEAERRTFTEDDTKPLGSSLLDGRRLKVVISIRSGLVNSSLLGKCIHYRQKSNGKWKRRRADMKIWVRGYAYSGECRLTSDTWNRHKNWKKRKSRHVASRIWLKWREAFVGQEGNICAVTAFLDNQEDIIFPLVLRR